MRCCSRRLHFCSPLEYCKNKGQRRGRLLGVNPSMLRKRRALKQREAKHNNNNSYEKERTAATTATAAAPKLLLLALAAVDLFDGSSRSSFSQAFSLFDISRTFRKRTRNMNGIVVVGDNDKSSVAAASSSSFAVSDSADNMSNATSEIHGTEADASEFLPPPLYITIGPPCSGKTTWLRSHLDGGGAYAVDDVSIDDQPGLYVPVPLEDWLFVTSDEAYRFVAANNGTSRTNKTDGSFDAASDRRRRAAYLTRRVYGRSVLDRMYGTRNDDRNGTSLSPPDNEQLELRYVLLRLANRISSERLEELLLRPTRKDRQDVDGGDDGNTTKAKRDIDFAEYDPSSLYAERQLLDVVEEYIATATKVASAPTTNGTDASCAQRAPQQFPLPSHVDLFIQERIFRPHHGEYNESALDQAQHQLFRLAGSAVVGNRGNKNQSMARQRTARPLAWGNTNTQPRQYKVALEAAAKSRRPVHFVVHQPSLRDMLLAAAPSDAEEVQEVEDLRLPSLFELSGDLKELLRRSLRRLVEKGRYVPAGTIWAMQKKTFNLLTSAAHRHRNERKRETSRGAESPPNQESRGVSAEGQRPFPPNFAAELKDGYNVGNDGSEDSKRPEIGDEGGGSDNAHRQLIAAVHVVDQEMKATSKFEMDRILAELANFHMNKNRTVSPRPPAKRPRSLGDNPNGYKLGNAGRGRFGQRRGNNSRDYNDSTRYGEGFGGRSSFTGRQSQQAWGGHSQNRRDGLDRRSYDLNRPQPSQGQPRSDGFTAASRGHQQTQLQSRRKPWDRPSQQRTSGNHADQQQPGDSLRSWERRGGLSNGGNQTRAVRNNPRGGPS